MWFFSIIKKLNIIKFCCAGAVFQIVVSRFQQVAHCKIDASCKSVISGFEILRYSPYVSHWCYPPNLFDIENVVGLAEMYLCQEYRCKLPGEQQKIRHVKFSNHKIEVRFKYIELNIIIFPTVSLIWVSNPTMRNGTRNSFHILQIFTFLSLNPKKNSVAESGKTPI